MLTRLRTGHVILTRGLLQKRLPITKQKMIVKKKKCYLVFFLFIYKKETCWGIFEKKSFLNCSREIIKGKLILFMQLNAESDANGNIDKDSEYIINANYIVICYTQ